MSELRPQKMDVPDSDSLPYAEPEADAKLDDVMLAMDVVDTLRHERMMVVRDVNAVERRENLVDRLRGIYRGQGIEVPDDILMDGVRALEEERFRYQPPRESLGTRLAMIYVNRRRWLPWVGGIFGIALLAGGISAAYEATETLEEARIERVAASLPADLDAARDAALDLARGDSARETVKQVHEGGEAALATGNIPSAERALDQLRILQSELALTYDIEIVSRPGELSGIDRYPDGVARTPANANYYLIVEGVTPSGDRVERLVENEETGEAERVDIWGQRVTRDLYQRVVADKRADGIVDARKLGTKDRGVLSIDYTSGEYDSGVLSGAITEWR